MTNLEMLVHVAHGLGELKDKVVFVGGATIELYIADPTAPQARPTKDVDCVIELVSRAAYYELEEKLRGLGFQHSIDKGDPICRWKYKGVRVDVMPTKGEILTFKNRWYPEGFSRAQSVRLPDGTVYACDLEEFQADPARAPFTNAWGDTLRLGEAKYRKAERVRG